jgi:hypothetical protein
MTIIRIVLYKDRFDVYVTKARDIMIRIVLNRREISGLHSCNFTCFVSPLSNNDKDKGQRRGTLYNSAPTVRSHMHNKNTKKFNFQDAL